MAELWFFFALEFGNNLLGQYLSKFDAPLVERVNLPDGTLRKNIMLVERNKFAERFRCEPVGKNRVRRPIALENAMRHEPIRRAFGLDLFVRFAESQRLGLGEDVRHEHVVMAAKGIESLTESDKVARNELGSLMNQLVEGMLAVGSRLAPVDRAGLIRNFGTVEGNMFAIAFHYQLLQIGGESFQVLLIRQNRDGLCTEEIIVPDAKKGHEHRQVAFERSCAEVLVHLVEAIEHSAEIIRADGKHRRKAYRRIHGVASADPIPEPEHVGGINTKLRHFSGVRRYRDKMFGDRLFIAAESCEQPFAGCASIRHRFERRESFRRDDEERLRGVEVMCCFGKVGAVDVGNEPENPAAVAVMFERFVGHHRPEVGATDTDVDYVANGFAGMALPLAAADAVAEIRHLIKYGVNLRHHVLAIYNDGCPFGARSATCRTARFSVTFIFSPRNIASMRSRRPDSSAS